MSAAPMVAIEDVTATFGWPPRAVIRAASFTVGAGERLALIGPSGSGKSTVLRLIVGLVLPTSGRVRVNGVLVTRDTSRAIRRRIGYVIQDGGLFPHLTADENVSFVARVDGW